MGRGEMSFLVMVLSSSLSGGQSGMNICLCGKGRCTLLYKGRDLERVRQWIPFSHSFSKIQSMRPWKPCQLFLLAEGLSLDWNDSFELEDIISLAC